MRRTRMLMALGALVIAAGLVAPGVAGAASPSAAGGLPALVNGKKAGPVALNTQQKTVASLALTKGRWLVFAKAIIVGTGGSASSHLGVDCRLKVGKRSDLITAVPMRQNGAGSRVPILLTTAGTLKGSGQHHRELQGRGRRRHQDPRHPRVGRQGRHPHDAQDADAG